MGNSYSENCVRKLKLYLHEFVCRCQCLLTQISMIEMTNSQSKQSNILIHFFKFQKSSEKCIYSSKPAAFIFEALSFFHIRKSETILNRMPYLRNNSLRFLLLFDANNSSILLLSFSFFFLKFRVMRSMSVIYKMK